MRFKYEVRISDRNSQNWAGHRAEKTVFLVICCLLYGVVFWQYLLMGDDLGNETSIDLLASSTVSPPPWLGTIEFSVEKLVFFVFAISRRNESNYKTGDNGNAMFQSYLSKIFKKKPVEDTLVPLLWGTREKNVCFTRIICSRCCTRRNLRFHVENFQHADQKQLTRR